MGKCILCKKGTFKTEYHPFTFKINGRTYTIPNIKHEVCSNCGEKLIEEETKKYIDEWIKEKLTS